MGLIKNWLVTGDTHGLVVDRIKNIPEQYNPNETALIILGDVGINYYLDEQEKNLKKLINYNIYCLRGNHEERPENLNYQLYYDDEIQGLVYLDSDNHNIKYFLDGESYIINGHSILTIGGAYSVDKEFRLLLNHKWFKDEELTEEELKSIFINTKNKNYDFVLTHTCPLSFSPIDLFLTGLDQSKVSNRMEIWLEKIKENINWGIWLFAHYHADRIQEERCEILYYDIKNLEEIYNFWWK